MFERLNNKYFLISFGWKDYNKLWEQVLLFGLEKGLNQFKLRFTNTQEYKKTNSELWQFKVSEDKSGEFNDVIIGRLNERAIYTFCKFKWQSMGFLSLEIFGEDIIKAIKSDDANELYLENFTEGELKELEKKLERFQRK